MPYYKDDTIHEKVLLKLAQWLQKESPDHKIELNSTFRKKRMNLLLNDGTDYYPDIIDCTAKLVYEVHWKGERKEESYRKLPDWWHGVDVFVTDSVSPSVIIVKMPGYKIARLDCRQQDDTTNFESAT